MKAAEFSAQIVECMALPAEQRHARLAALHTTIFATYTAAVRESRVISAAVTAL